MEEASRRAMQGSCSSRRYRIGNFCCAGGRHPELTRGAATHRRSDYLGGVLESAGGVLESAGGVVDCVSAGGGVAEASGAAPDVSAGGVAVVSLGGGMVD